MNGRPEIVHEAGEGKFTGPSAPAYDRRGLANFNFNSGLGQDNCCRKAIGSASDDRSLLHPLLIMGRYGPRLASCRDDPCSSTNFISASGFRRTSTKVASLPSSTVSNTRSSFPFDSA